MSININKLKSDLEGTTQEYEWILEEDEYVKILEAAKAIHLTDTKLQELITSHEQARLKESLLQMFTEGLLKLIKDDSGEAAFKLINLP